MHTMDRELLKRIIEAALLASGQPLTLVQLVALFPDEQAVSSDNVSQALHALEEDCVQRGVELVEVASGFRYQVKREVHPHITRLWSERQTRYGRAVLETLALIAYRQPITRGEIEQIRGVAVSTNIVKTLEEREWIRVVGHRDVPSKPALFGTTRAFLDYFGLKSLDQLPSLADLNDIPDIDPELPLEGLLPVLTNIALAEPDAPDSDSETKVLTTQEVDAATDAPTEQQLVSDPTPAEPTEPGVAATEQPTS